MYVYEKMDEKLVIGNELISMTLNNVSVSEKGFSDNQGLSEKFMTVRCVSDGVENEYNIWEDISVIEMPMHNGVFELPIKGNNYTLRTVKFAAVTDYHDTLTSESVYFMFRGAIPKRTGNIFYLDDPLMRESFVFISTAPDCVSASFEVSDGKVKINACGYGIVYGKCKTKETEELCRAWYRHKCKPTKLYTMANTWGDYNGYSRVADDFIKKEIDAASQIGIDALQIDDGWQKGCTDDPTIRDEKNRRTFKGDFWELKKERFKNGMEEMRDYAKENGVELGLWFAPDSQNCYERLERDISVLKAAYDNWKMRYFKFDMLYVENMEMYKAFEKMLSKVYSFGNDVFVQLDVTNGIRCGYLAIAQYGRIFVENRYTKLRTSYPHRVLRNLWNICKYVPACKFQFELINPTLNADQYDSDDVFAPINYDMDYLFAVTMMSNPLVWMEVQFLPNEQREQLKRVLPVWKEIREELAKSDVEPIGQRPDGCQVTGFAAHTADSKKTYLLLFREVTDETTFTYSAEKTIKCVKLLASNGNVMYNAEGSSINVHFDKMRSYALVELEF